MPDLSAKNLRLEYLDPEQLNDNPSNWRTHPAQQTEALDAVFNEVGWAGALLYNEQTGHLIDGHARKKLHAGTGPVPVLIGSWDEETEKKILATLDPIAAMAEADADVFEELMSGISLDDDFGDVIGNVAESLGIIEPPDPNDPNSHYTGMPDSGNYEKRAVRTIIVHFEKGENVEQFAKMIGQDLTSATKTIWIPEHKREKIEERFEGSDES